MPKKASARNQVTNTAAANTSAPSGKKTGRNKIANGNGGFASRRAEILAIAGRLFAEQGFEATSVRQIAKEVNILSGSLYHHFETKEEILHEILRQAVVPMMEKTLKIAHSGITPEMKLITLIIYRFWEIRRDYRTFGIIYNNRNFFRGKEEFNYVEEAKTNGFEAMESVLKAGIDAGEFKPDLDTYLTIGSIFRMISGAADWFITGSFVRIANEPESYSFDKVIDYHLDFILSAVRAPARITQPIPREDCVSFLNSID